MSRFLNVETFFEHVFLVDLSPSLLEVARKRFARLGWKNVTVVCQDARTFRLPAEYRPASLSPYDDFSIDLDPSGHVGKAELVTMSYSLSMIPGRCEAALCGHLI